MIQLQHLRRCNTGNFIRLTLFTLIQKSIRFWNAVKLYTLIGDKQQRANGSHQPNSHTLLFSHQLMTEAEKIYKVKPETSTHPLTTLHPARGEKEHLEYFHALSLSPLQNAICKLRETWQKGRSALGVEGRSEIFLLHKWAQTYCQLQNFAALWNFQSAVYFVCERQWKSYA